ncbi:MAG: ABC transporter ATP-binding protein, partial [Aestuariibacter sp.]|nr:ABC transporter ATP-binding protein [Aestuariibacter sp.]
MLTGDGELWVNSQGLPARLILNTHTPEINERFDSQATTMIDYRYDEARVGAALGLVADMPEPIANEGAPILEAPEETAVSSMQTAIKNTPLQTILTNSLLTFLTLVLIVTFTFMLIRNHKATRVTVPVAVAALLVLNPLLSPLAMAHQQSLKTKPVTLNEALGLEENTKDASHEPENQLYTPQTALETNTLQTTTDSSTQCGDGSQTDDSDADGLDDFTEICLGISRYSVDTDADLITDTLEVYGFEYGGQTWYSNPMNADSNGDGVNDGLEWASSHKGQADNWDLDKDGTPNLWDFD